MAEQTHERYEATDAGKGSSDRAFGFVFTGLFLLLGLSPLRHGLPPRIWLLAASLVTLCLALFFRGLLAPFNWLWTRLAFLLAKVTTPVVLGIIFYGVFSPVSALLKLLGADPLRLKSSQAEETFWIPRVPPGPPPESMRRMF